LNLDKCEPSCLSRKPVAHDSYRVDSDPLPGKKVLNVGLIRRVWQIPYKELLH
jgi:hypothetical protein